MQRFTEIGVDKGFRQRLLRVVFFLTFPVFFVQSAFVNIDGMSEELVLMLKNIDEIVTMLFVVLVYFLSRYHDGSFQKRLWMLLGVYLAQNAVSAVINDIEVSVAATSMFLFIKGYLFYVATARLTVSEGFVRLVLLTLVASLVICTIVAFLQLAGFSLPWKLGYRLHLGMQSVTSIFNHHTRWATASALGVATAMAFVLMLPQRKIWYGLLLFLGAGLLLSTSRRHVVTLPFAFFLCAWIFFPDSVARMRRILSYGAVAVVAAILLLPVLRNYAEGTMQEYVEHARSRDRYVLYEGAWDLSRANPLLGRGPGTYGSWTSVRSDSPVYWELGIERWVPVQYRNGAPYASYLGENGFVGLALVLMIFAAMGRRTVELARKARGPYDRTLAAMVFILFVDGVLETIVHPFFTGSIATYVFFGSFGLLEARYRTVCRTHAAVVWSRSRARPAAAKAAPGHGVEPGLGIAGAA